MGLQTTVEKAFQTREELFKTNHRENIYEVLVKKFGVKKDADAKLIAQKGFDAFHNRPVGENISLFPGTLETLKALKNNYKIFLVTMGGVDTQKRKVEKLGLKNVFDGIEYSDIKKSDRKTDSFLKILKSQNLEAQNILCVGNRIDSEIHDAKELGMQTVLFNHGEYKNLKPTNAYEKPDHIIDNLSELQRILA
jgi:putative hydrolase of the HAD superfamily